MFGRLIAGARAFGKVVAPKLPVVGLVTGLGCIAVGVGLAIYETSKHAKEDQEELENEIAEIKEAHHEEKDEAPEYEVARIEKEEKREIRKAKIRGLVKFVRRHVPSFVALVVGFTLVLTAFGLLRRTCLKLSATVGTLTTMVETYRQRAEMNNPGSDFNNVWGTKQGTVETEEVDENGAVHTVKYDNANILTDDLGIASPYARVFNKETAPTKFDSDVPMMYNEAFINGVQQSLNIDLATRKYIPYNEGLRKLGMEECEAGEDMGWSKDLGDGVVDFRVNKIFKPIGDGKYETILVIDPNVTDISSKKTWRRKF